MAFTKTELHTHLMGMLSSKQFLKLLSKYVDCIPWPLNQPVTKETSTLNIDDAIENKKIRQQLMIPKGQTVDYSQLNNLYNSRTELLKFAVERLAENLRTNIQEKNKYVSQEQFEKEILQYAEKRIYDDYINASLQELIKQNVKYVEISYSNSRIIKNCTIYPEIQEQIKCKFLLSTDRARTVKQMKKSAKDLKKLLNDGIAVGFDIMGQERLLNDAEKDYTSTVSFKRKLEILFDELLKHENTTLRIHSGETPESLNNTVQILEYIDEIQKSKGIIIPPPEIRIGHGIYFEEDNYYKELLKKFKCIIEINASSNMRLKNIDDITDIPYDYYIQNHIPIVISTDGHGLYDTTVRKEDNIARKALENIDRKQDYSIDYYDLVVSDDAEILRKKGK